MPKVRYTPPNAHIITVILTHDLIYFIPGNCWYGVDVMNEDIADNFEACVWEPSIIRVNALTAASEAACMIMSVDETIKSPKSDAPMQAGGMPGRGMGRPMMG